MTTAPEDGAPARESVDALAAELFARYDAGEEPDLAPWLARLASDEERAELVSLLEAARAAERRLPTPVSALVRIAGRYRVLEPIGSGGMGRVFSAWDEHLRRRVAVKVLNALDAGDAERREMFVKESHLLAALQHPGIVAVHEAGQDGELAYIVMDLVDGRSLADVIDRARRLLEQESAAERLVPREGRLLERALGKPIPEGRQDLVDARSWTRTAARIVLEISRVLEAAHAQKVVHRDLKPQNVMLLGGANPVVLDFGLAGSVDVSEGAVTRGLYGSVAYLAPEQVASHQVGNDPRTDVYQIGLVLYELLTLRRAFPGQAVGEVLEKIRAGELKAPRQWNPHVPRDLQAVCRMALEPEPEQRYQTARELREDLERFLEGREPPLAARAFPLRAAARRVRWLGRRHPVVAATLGMGLVFLASLWLYASEPRYAMSAIRVSDDELELVREGSVVRPGDWLGVQVDADSDGYLYALSVFGEPEARRVAPVRALTRDDLGRNRRADEPFGLAIPAGRTNVLCSTVEPHPSEGLLVFASSGERPELELWLSELERMVLAEHVEGVPYDLARRRFAGLSGPARGVRPELDDDPARLERLKDVLAERESALVKEWRGSGWQAFAVDCRVEGGR